MKLLRYFIQEVLLAEKVRSKAFSWREFTQFQDFENLISYASNADLQFLGEGSSRASFVLSSGKVLKIAKNDFGCRQNLAEAEVFEALKSDWIPKIFKRDKEGRWMVSELVRPATAKEVKDFLGTPVGNLVYWPKAAASEHAAPGTTFYDRNIRPWLSKFTPEQRENILSLGRFLNQSKVSDEDLDEIANWGVNTQGRVVLLDTGFTPSAGYRDD